MTLKLYNTYSRQVEPLVPLIRTGWLECIVVVRRYTILPISAICVLIFFEDVLRKTIKRAGFSLKHAMNITDVGHLTSDADEGDDKMVLAAEKSIKQLWILPRKYEDTFLLTPRR